MLIKQWLDAHGPAQVGSRIDLCQTLGNHAQFFLSLVHGYSGPQARDYEIIVGDAILQLLWSGRQGQKHFGDRWILHDFRQNADHGVRLPVEVDNPAQHRRIRTETLLPECVAEHGDGVVPRLTLAILINATEQCVGTQHLKKAGRRECCLHMKRFSCSRQAHGGVIADGEVSEGSALLFPVLVISQGNLLIVAAAATVLFCHDDHAAQVRHGKRAQHYGVHHAEYRSVHADADGKRERRSYRKSGRLPQLANGVAQVTPKNLEEGESALHTITFPGLCHAPEGAQCGCPGLFFRHAALHVFFYGELDMATQLVVEIFIEPFSAKEDAQRLSRVRIWSIAGS